ncbi:Protein spaetzle [Armadillidium vulgare]|nr:Protein spaetzle [Armadillidium vulgare]
MRFPYLLIQTIIEEENGNFPNLRNRVGFSSEQTLCASVETIIYPKRGQTSKKDWVFILNQGPVQQGVKVEKCLKPNGACVLGGGPIELTACRQKYIYKKLLALDTSGHNIVSESIYMPSCCVCYVSNDFVSTRSSFRTRLFSANTANKTKD